MKNQNIHINRDIHNDLGAYHYEDDNVTVVSEDSFEDILDTVGNLPDDGRTVVTPELSLLNADELADLQKFMKNFMTPIQLHARMERLLESTRDSTNTVLVGAPIASKKHGYNNGLYIVRNGETIQKQRKSLPGVFEENSGIFTYEDDPNRYKTSMGAVAVICSELPMTYDLSALEKQAKTFYMPAAWGVESLDPAKAKRDYGSVDEYNEATLNASAQLAASEAPNLEKIYIADRPMSGSPQVGKLEIHRTED